jgi:hypothetical protein
MSEENKAVVRRWVEAFNEGKTGWDWLQLLGTLAIPVVAVVVGVWFTSVQSQTVLW